MLKTKTEGQVFTPQPIVKMILDSVGYFGENIRTKKIMEPSFGDGAFLIEIVRRIIDEIKNPKGIVNILQNNVFGIEKDPEVYKLALENVNKVLLEKGISFDFSKNLICADSLDVYTQYLGCFDFVVGNPPYVRIHNIENRDTLKNFQFSTGNTDLYVLFYELGLKMLNNAGKLGFITPNSFLKNTSQKTFRNNLLNYVESIFDFKNSKIFQNASTYTCICILSKNKPTSILYKEYKMLDLVFERNYNQKEFQNQFLNKPWNLSSESDSDFLNKIALSKTKIRDIACVQNGIATLRDKVFIGYVWEDEANTIPYLGKHTDENKTVYFQDNPIESQILHRCVKASKFNGQISNLYILYPYNNNTPIPFPELKARFPLACQYLFNHRRELLQRDMEKNSDWFLFGRSQGLIHSNQPKIVFKHIIPKTNSKIIPYFLEEDVVVYSGVFITGENLDELMKIFKTNDFAKYCVLVGKDMSGEYVSIGTKQIKEFGISDEK